MTIKDIAKVCGVSVSTVSRVINQKPDVSEEVRKRVLAVIDDQGYVPNTSARDLVRTQSDAIGVVVRGVGNPFYTDILKAISQEIDKNNFTMVLRQIDSDEDEVKAGAILEREKKLKGLIFLGGRFDYTAAEMLLIRVPYVFCSYTNRFGSLHDSDYSSVAIDDYQTAYQAVETLIHMGHSRIAALVSDRNDHSISQMRYRGYCDALANHQIPFDSSLLVETGDYFMMPAAYAGTKKLLQQCPDLTALFTASDTMAMAAIKALTDEGKRVPEDCSVIAIDGLSMSEYFIPTLTTMVQPVEEMGRESVHLLLEMMQENGRSRHVRLEATLRTGSSVRMISN